ncbi:MAG: hypothetical protein ABEJ28_03125 [Salinigranum sp.]
MSESKPTRELLKVEADDPKTHALLNAVVQARATAERTGYMEHYSEVWREWEALIADVYFADREASR